MTTTKAKAEPMQGLAEWLREQAAGSAPILGNRLHLWADAVSRSQSAGQDAAMAPATDPDAPSGFLCYAWGETDYPVATLVRTVEEVGAFLCMYWFGEKAETMADGDRADYEAAMDRVRADRNDPDAWDGTSEVSWKFEIGGVSITKVYFGGLDFLPAHPPLAAPSAAGSEGADTIVHLDDHGMSPPVWEGPAALIAATPRLSDEDRSFALEMVTQYGGDVGEEQTVMINERLVDMMTVLGYRRRPTPAPEGQGVAAELLDIPDDCPHIIWFDDRDREPILLAGSGARAAALKAYARASAQWNAHLFVRMDSNSRDAPFGRAALAAQPVQEVVAPAAQAPMSNAELYYEWSMLPGRPTCYWPDVLAFARAVERRRGIGALQVEQR